MDDPTALPSFPPPADEHPLRGRVLDALRDEGLDPNLDDDGDVVVVVDEQRLFVRCGEGQLPVMRTFGQWRISEEIPDDVTKRLETACDVSMRLNLVKCGVRDDVLISALDLVVTPEMPLGEIVKSSIHAVLHSVGLWNAIMTGQDVEHNHG